MEDIVYGARERLAGVRSGGAREEQVAALRRFLRLETERLRMRHRVGLGGDEIAAGRSHQVDLAVQRVCQLAEEGFAAGARAELCAMAVVALGGYGRGELAPFSDIDILFLHDGRAPEVVKEFAARTLTLLWDTGFTVGHSFRSVDECVAIAREDVHSRTAMAEARRLAGSEAVFARFEQRLEEAVFRNGREAARFVEALRVETEMRYRKYGRGVGLLEPNVKESAGGLRDLHTILWLGRARLHGRSLEALRDGGHLSAGEYAAARRARAFLARVRNEAHFAAGRKADVITLELQPELATNLGYVDSAELQASERLMGDYYLRARRLHDVCESYGVRNGLLGRRRGRRLRLALSRSRSRLEVQDGLVHLPRAADGFDGDAMAILGLFAFAQAEGAALGDDVSVAVRRAARHVDARFRSSRAAAHSFLRILGRRGRVASALRAMHETGFLGRYLPEFGRVTFLAQHDHYHRYTVDEHTLAAIEALDEVALARASDSPLRGFKRALDEIEDAAPLYLALLLHDVGKGRRASHVPIGARMTARVASRLRLEPEAAAAVVLLVESHLTMSHLSQRRDLTEGGLIERFAARVGSVTRLNELVLLTYADSCGVGPSVWSAWKSALLWELYARTRAALTGKAKRLDVDLRMRAHARVAEALAGEFAASDVERHLAMLPEKYLRSARTAEIAAHLRLVSGLSGRPVVVEWSAAPDGVHTRLVVCTRDAPGVFARLAGTLTANGLNIRSVDVWTREDGVVLDTFAVEEATSGRALAEPQRRRIEGDLAAAIAGTLDVDGAVAGWRRQAALPARRRKAVWTRKATVRFDQDASALATVVEVGAEDELGLAYRIAHTLASLGLSITLAKIASEKTRAWDVFYVVNGAGGKLTPAETTAVEVALAEALGGGTA